MSDVLENQSTGQNAEFFIATVTGGTASAGYKLQFAGESSARNKSYKMLKNGSETNFASGSRVIVIKLSGTFVVLGKL